MTATSIIFIVLLSVATLFCIIGTVIAMRLLVKEARTEHVIHAEHGYAGFWKRLAAFIIDTIIIIIASLIIEVIAGNSGGARLILLVGAWLYFALMESSKYQATLGKMVLGIKVADVHGNKLSFGRATGRYFGKILSELTIYAGFIMAGFTTHKQALHDLLTDAVVVND